MNQPWVTTKKYTRRFRAADGVVHNVYMRKHNAYPKNMTFCRVPSWRLNGRWLEPDATVTCMGCLADAP